MVSGRRRRAARAALSVLALVVAACSSASESLPAGTTSATLTLALASRPNDAIASLALDVSGLDVRGEDGSAALDLASPVRIDLATLDEHAHVLGVLAVRPLVYDEIALTLDLARASGRLLGESVDATIVDGAAQPYFAPLTLTIEIPEGLVAPSNRNRLMVIDLDLAHAAEAALAANRIRFEPLVALRADPVPAPPLSLTGAVVSVDELAMLFRVELSAASGEVLGTCTAGVSTETRFQVNGVARLGAAGLARLAAAGPGTSVQCFGAIDPARRRVAVTDVEAGRGTHAAGMGWVEGQVIGRVGGAGGDARLDVLGRGRAANDAAQLLETTFTVDTSFADTTVLQRGSVPALSTDDLVVGQTVAAFGTLTGTTLDAATSASVVRTLPARLRGFASAPPSGGLLTLALARVGPRTPGDFAWSESGPTPPDPDALVAQVDALADGLSIGTDTPIELDGAFTEIADATVDFLATRVTNHASSPPTIVLRDREAGMLVEAIVAEEGLTLTVTGEPEGLEAARVDRGFTGSTALPADLPLALTPVSEGATLFALRHRGDQSVQVHTRFDGFADALRNELGRGAVLFDLVATGSYTEATSSMIASFVGIVLD